MLYVSIGILSPSILIPKSFEFIIPDTLLERLTAQHEKEEKEIKAAAAAKKAAAATATPIKKSPSNKKQM